MHTRQPCRPAGVPLPRNLDAEGVVYPRTVTSLSTCCLDIIDKSQFSRLRRDSTFRFSSSFIIHPCLPFVPSFPLNAFLVFAREGSISGEGDGLDIVLWETSSKNLFLYRYISLLFYQRNTKSAFHRLRGIDFSNLQARSSNVLGVNCCTEDGDGSQTSGKSKKKKKKKSPSSSVLVRLVSNERSTFSFHRVTIPLLGSWPKDKSIRSSATLSFYEIPGDKSK